MNQNTLISWDQIQWDRYSPLALHRLTTTDGPAVQIVADLVAFLLGINVNVLDSPSPTLLKTVIYELQQTARELQQILDTRQEEV